MATTDPKIGQWVFSLPQCPERATAAVVNHDGELVWVLDGGHENIVTTADGYWRNGNWGFNYGANKVYCDNSDWVNSFTIRARLKNRMTDSVKRMED